MDCEEKLKGVTEAYRIALETLVAKDREIERLTTIIQEQDNNRLKLARM